MPPSSTSPVSPTTQLRSTTCPTLPIGPRSSPFRMQIHARRHCPCGSRIDWLASQVRTSSAARNPSSATAPSTTTRTHDRWVAPRSKVMALPTTSGVAVGRGVGDGDAGTVGVGSGRMSDVATGAASPAVGDVGRGQRYRRPRRGRDNPGGRRAASPSRSAAVAARARRVDSSRDCGSGTTRPPAASASNKQQSNQPGNPPLSACIVDQLDLERAVVDQARLAGFCHGDADLRASPLSSV